MYRVTNLDGQDVARATGLDLMVQGLPLDRSSDRGQPRGYSRTLLLEQVDAK